MSSSPPEGQRRRSAPSFFERLGIFKRHQPKGGKQVDYRERWPTVTTLVEQRSESGFFAPGSKPPDKPAMVRALERASISLQWIQDRIESVHDHLDHSIEVAEAKAQKRASLLEKPTAPGKSRHPYDTGVESHTREHAEADDAASTATVQRMETRITAETLPGRSQNRWRLPFTGAGKAEQQNRPPKPVSPTPAASNASDEGTEEDITAGHLPRPQWKSTKDRRPSQYPDRKAPPPRVDSSSERASPLHGGGLKPGGSRHTTTPKGPSPEPSMRSGQMHSRSSQRKPRRASRETSAGSRDERPRSASKRSSTPGTTTRTPTPLSQQTARRVSGQFATALGLLSPQTRSRTTSANRGLEEHAQQQQQKRDVALRDQQHHDDAAVGLAASPELSPTALKSRAKSPTSGAFRHLLGVVKGGVPPSRAVSPLSMNGNGEETERAKTGRQEPE
ncbi:uncharacterized protein PG998_006510 [Apiospora kogelbergensis]|uniref:uncharacterized protein n=1 Tax=Apiospora kogelbergensis TaxID=1337665 RepID=UPI00312D1B8A